MPDLLAADEWLLLGSANGVLGDRSGSVGDHRLFRVDAPVNGHSAYGHPAHIGRSDGGQADALDASDVEPLMEAAIALTAVAMPGRSYRIIGSHSLFDEVCARLPFFEGLPPSTLQCLSASGFGRGFLRSRCEPVCGRLDIAISAIWPDVTGGDRQHQKIRTSPRRTRSNFHPDRGRTLAARCTRGAHRWSHQRAEARTTAGFASRASTSDRRPNRHAWLDGMVLRGCGRPFKPRTPRHRSRNIQRRGSHRHDAHRFPWRGQVKPFSLCSDH